jgi:hypothetical protein
MKDMLKRTALGFALGATVLTVAASPADAQRYRHRDRDNSGAVVAAGIAGLVIGAAVASSDRDRRGYYDRGYSRPYDRPYGGYYDPRYRGDQDYYRNRGYYPQNGYYWNQYESRGWRGCTVRRVYDPYIGHRVKVRYCR